MTWDKILPGTTTTDLGPAANGTGKHCLTTTTRPNRTKAYRIKTVNIYACVNEQEKETKQF
jgi:hypothetical protein